MQISPSEQRAYRFSKALWICFGSEWLKSSSSIVLVPGAHFEVKSKFYDCRLKIKQPDNVSQGFSHEVNNLLHVAFDLRATAGTVSFTPGVNPVGKGSSSNSSERASQVVEHQRPPVGAGCGAEAQGVSHVLLLGNCSPFTAR